MELSVLKYLLGFAVLLPLCSFFFIFVTGRWLKEFAGYIATGAIVGAGVLSFAGLFLVWLPHHWPAASGHHATAHENPGHDDAGHDDAGHDDAGHDDAGHDDAGHDDAGHDDATADAHVAANGHGQATEPPYLCGDYYTLGQFGKLRLTIGYYVDALTMCMFCMVTLIASCIHFYAIGYMHDELHDVTDHEVHLADGHHLHRPGRFPRFFQALSLFCFSMLGLVLSGNIAQTFVFWELVGICSYFLIGFYVERHSASTAANKAFIVNRVGDFGMIIGLMALWSSLGTFAFGTVDGNPGLFELVRPGEDHKLVVPDGMVRFAAREEIEKLAAALPPESSPEALEAAVVAKLPEWRDPEVSGKAGGYGYWLLIVAGVGIFCGCVGKSAQFPLHVWLPDAMEGPTPVSALVHSATMVAAGVFLVARFYPVFAPEVLLVIAVIGCMTLFMAATIAITATDIKRVLAYSTVSQLGYMMMALGVGAWLAGSMHLITHAFFKSLLFMCSGSVIHAVHTNEMPQMGGLRRKMPWTAYTMLIGCLAIAGAGIPFLIGFSGYYSKDSILEQAMLFKSQEANAFVGSFLFYAAAGGAAITAFYMFRLWYMTFAGEPRDHHRYDHARESPPIMYVPLVVLSIFAISVAWGMNPIIASVHDGVIGGAIALIVFLVLRMRQSKPGQGGSSNVPIVLSGIVLAVGLLFTVAPSLSSLTLSNLLEQARPAGTLAGGQGSIVEMVWPNEHDSHAADIKTPVTLLASGTALAGFLLATVFYGLRLLDAGEVQRAFRPIHRFLVNKWWFDELYDIIFVRPTHWISGMISSLDRRWIDGLIDGLAAFTRWFSSTWEAIADRTIVDGTVNRFASWMYGTGLSLRRIQTGRLREYVMFIAIGTIAVFVIATLFLKYTLAG
ncbi:MAG: NADH-quinone oxidoreductase subunit L [Planctomycetales bacterium]|nr:NADH-quinone oxidoreductase subunit L [Planctomycetales bacterium]